MRRSMILDVCVNAEFHTLLLISLFMLFSGHNQPGGGFPGGLVAASAFCLRYVAGDRKELDRSVIVAPTTLMGVGLLLAISTGVISLALGHDFLETANLEVHLPFIGPAHTSSVLFFDTGVYLVVLGMVVLLLQQLGSPGPDDEVDTTPESDPLLAAGTEPETSEQVPK
jgi:multisubunit Na+/H+ antiporter MnhB subunit